MGLENLLYLWIIFSCECLKVGNKHKCFEFETFHSLNEPIRSSLLMIKQNELQQFRRVNATKSPEVDSFGDIISLQIKK